MTWLIDADEAVSLRNSVRCITFDLDDTLWDCAPVITRAEQILYDWLKHHHPVITDKYEHDDLLPHRIAFLRDHTDHSHDLTHQRKLWLQALANEFDLGHGLIEPAFATYWQARNEVIVYDGVSETLEVLASQFTLGAITNGNADVYRIGLGEYFEFVVRSEEAGCAKPDPRIFEQAAELAKIPLENTLHVGDSLATDVSGARRAGAFAAWVGEPAEAASHEHKPHLAVRHIAELVALLI